METINRTWPAGTHKMAERIRTFDWASTPLGQIESWSQSLRTIVDLMLSIDVPMSLFWGPEAIHVYNDACAATIAERHPAALGASALETFGDHRHFFEALFQEAPGGGTASLNDLPYSYLPLSRQQTMAWFDFTYTPVRGEAGTVDGVLAILIESTARVLAGQELVHAATDVKSARAALANELSTMAWPHELNSVALTSSGPQKFLDAILDASSSCIRRISATCNSMTQRQKRSAQSRSADSINRFSTGPPRSTRKRIQPTDGHSPSSSASSSRTSKLTPRMREVCLWRRRRVHGDAVYAPA